MAMWEILQFKMDVYLFGAGEKLFISMVGWAGEFISTFISFLILSSEKG